MKQLAFALMTLLCSCSAVEHTRRPDPKISVAGGPDANGFYWLHAVKTPKTWHKWYDGSKSIEETTKK